MKDLWKGIYIFLGGALVVLVVTHASGAASVFGSLFSGVNSLGTTLTGANVKG